jgi:hypothetical protein
LNLCRYSKGGLQFEYLKNLPISEFTSIAEIAVKTSGEEAASQEKQLEEMIHNMKK